MTRSVLIWVQHLLGIGHLQRARHIAAALARDGFAVTLVSGGETPPGFPWPRGVEIVRLPSLRARDGSFSELLDGSGRRLDDRLREKRRETLLAAHAAASPQTILTETYPFGRRAFRFELDPLLAAARAQDPRPLVFSSIRDILVPPREETRGIEIVRLVAAEYDGVLVHGDPRLVPLEKSFPQAAELGDRVIYTGYVAAPDAADPTEAGRDEVLISAGGGAAGARLLEIALAARKIGCLPDRIWRIIAGPNLPAEAFARLRARLLPHMFLERSRGDFPAMLRHCHVSVSQAGYNTVLDILAARARAVLVPYAEGRETEQALRAQILAERGVVETVSPDELSPESLAEAIERALARKPPPIAIDMAGARKTARLLALCASPC